MKYTTNDYFLYYIKMSGTEDCQKLFETPDNIAFLNTLTEERVSYRYALDK